MRSGKLRLMLYGLVFLLAFPFFMLVLYNLPLKCVQENCA